MNLENAGKAMIEAIRKKGVAQWFCRTITTMMLEKNSKIRIGEDNISKSSIYIIIIISYILYCNTLALHSLLGRFFSFGKFLPFAP